ncbi:MAG: MarR family winged helix-turn-helix transcriptional regulator [Actinomycetota bacterium]
MNTPRRTHAPESDSNTEAPSGYFYIIKQLELALRPRFTEVCSAHSVTLAQYTALTFLERSPGMSGSELARRIFVRAQTIAKAVDPLVDQGLVRREPDPGHGRRILLFLTERGLATVHSIAPQISQIEEELLVDLTAEERRQFLDHLRRTRNTFVRTNDRPDAR